MAWARRNPDRILTSRLKYRYKMTRETYELLLAAQAGLCWICKQREANHVDHEHATGMVRGILCFKCNTGLGSFLDSRALLARAIEYLSRNDRAVQVVPNTGERVDRQEET